MKIDVYLKVEVRSREAVDLFFSRFAGKCSPVAENYPYPELEDEAELIFFSVCELLDFCCAKSSASYAIYWSAESASLDQYNISVTFMSGSGILFGVHPDDRHEGFVRHELAGLMPGNILVGYEIPPPRDDATFNALLEQAKRLD